MGAGWMGAGGVKGGGGGVSNEMGAGRKERLYLCLGFLAAGDFAWVVFREWQRVNVRLRMRLQVLSVHMTWLHSVLFQFSLPDCPVCVFQGVVYGRCLESTTGLRG